MAHIVSVSVDGAAAGHLPRGPRPRRLQRERLGRLAGLVAPGGRLILGAYGSRSRGMTPADPADALERCGYPVAGRSAGGDPVTSRFAWTGS